MAKEHSYFMRFYGTTQENINKCIDELEIGGMGFAIFKPLKHSINPFVPAGNNTEVDLCFLHKHHMLAAKNSPSNHAIYMKYACPGVEGAEFSNRNKGDPSYVVA